jgi:hypothetical protein
MTKIVEDCLKPQPRNDGAPMARYWEREPEPLEGWTFEEQRALAAAARANHKERTRGLTDEDARCQFLRLLMRHVPDKSASECDRCLEHVEANRIAYFGATSRSASTSPLRSSRTGSPLRSSRPNSPLRTSRPGSPLQSGRPDSPLRASRPDSPLRSSRTGALTRTRST